MPQDRPSDGMRKTIDAHIQERKPIHLATLKRAAGAILVALVTQACSSGAPEPRARPGPCAAPAMRGAEAVSGTGPIRRLSVSADRARDLTSSEWVFIKIEFAGEVPDHSALIDADGSRDTGMWTLQSSLSQAGWNLLVDHKGSLHTHAGSSVEWDWQRLEVEGFGRSVRDREVNICLPVAALEGARQINVAAMAGETEWLPAVFDHGVAYPPQPAPLPKRVAAKRPGRLAIQYSAEPWRARGCEDIACAARAYGAFDHVVLGSGLEDDSHPSHDRTGITDLVDQTGRHGHGGVGLHLPRPAGPIIDLVARHLLFGRRHRQAGAIWSESANRNFIDEADLGRTAIQKRGVPQMASGASRDNAR